MRKLKVGVTMDFISNQELQIREMLAVIGVDSVEALFSAIPESIHLARPLVEDGLSEFEGMRLMEAIAARNTFPSMESYLGAGAYEHHIPAIVSAITSKSEFLTSYTPYQAEASQGMLQAIFEFQSVICALTGMDAANASLYDGASASAEAVLMALRHHKERRKILIARGVHPHYSAAVRTAVSSHGTEIVEIPFSTDGSLDSAALHQHLDSNTAAVLVQTPNALGVLETLPPVSAAAKACGALTILAANPLAYGLFASAGEVGADIAVGDGQPFGLPLNFGGPYVGYMACRQELLRQMPGRIVGETVDVDGRRGFVLTLQAREQHIRREKATSNVCTNQALAALACLVAILWYGPEGIKKLALTNYQRANYLKQKLKHIPGVVVSDAPTFNEFAVHFPRPLDVVQAYFRSHGIEPGLDVAHFYPEVLDTLLVSVTETKNSAQLDRFVEIARDCCQGKGG